MAVVLLPTLTDGWNELQGHSNHKTRCRRFYQTLSTLNREQGIGFLVFRTVVNRKLLNAVAAALAGSSGVVISGLREFRHHTRLCITSLHAAHHLQRRDG